MGRISVGVSGCAGVPLLVVSFVLSLSGASHLYGQPCFKRGDANADGAFDLSDAIFTLSSLFLGGPVPPCKDSADSNDDGALDISDASYRLNFLFLGGRDGSDPRSRSHLAVARW